MNRLRKMSRCILVFIVAVPLLLSGCGSSSSSSFSQQVNLEKAALLLSINNSLLKPLPKSIAGWEWLRFTTDFGKILKDSSYNLSMQKVSYQSTGADGKPRTLSGLLILPESGGSRPAVPILMFQHGTEPYRQFSPSRYLENRSSPTDYPEVMVAAAIASTGYAVAMADYEGLGDSIGPQPYVHGETLAIQVVDMLKATRTIITASSSPCSWNDQLFLMGYSEGGYVTMAATRELQKINYANEFTVTASAPLSGPHDLSGTMRDVILADTTSKAPYFLPFILNSFNYVYSGQTDLFSPSVTMKPEFAGTVPPLFDGFYPADEISEAMGMSYSSSTLIVPKITLTSQFLALLADDTSQVVALLRENDSYRGWAPTVPLRMVHHGNDELVPFANSQAAFNSFSTAGAKRHVTLVRESTTIPVSSDPVMTTHVSAAFPILYNGWKWLETFKK